MNEKQRKAVEDQIRKGCQHFEHAPNSVCGKKATTIIIWSFEDQTKMSDEHPVLAFVCCDEHAEAARDQRPKAPPHIFVRVTEESLKPLVFQ